MKISGGFRMDYLPEPLPGDTVDVSYVACMDKEVSGSSDLVPVTLYLDSRVVDWIDGLAKHFGIRSRGALVSHLLSDLMGDQGDEPPA